MGEEYLKPVPVVQPIKSVEIQEIEARLDAIEAIQQKNLPKLLGAISRLARLEKAVNQNTLGIAAVSKAFKDAETLRQTNAQKLDDILSYVAKGKGVVAFLNRHKGKLATFALGVAVAKGWVTAENGHNFLSIFGL